MLQENQYTTGKPMRTGSPIIRCNPLFVYVTSRMLVMAMLMPVLGVASPQGVLQSVTLPAGTEISIRTIDLIESEKADVNKEYAASLTEAVLVNGLAVIPANADAFLRVSDIQTARFRRRASLSISLIGVAASGHRTPLETAKLASQAGLQRKRMLTGAAVGAGTGAGIGAIAGGGVGAAVGAAAGGVSGAVVAKVTGKGVSVLPETRLTFRLTQEAVISAPVSGT